MTTALKLAALQLDCPHPACERAVLILETAHESAGALLSAYDLARQQRGRPRGMTTDAEQDLLRSMLVMAGAGLDATVKQLIQDALPALLQVDDKAQNSFEKFVARRLAPEGGTGGAGAGIRLLASALASPAPQRRLISEYVDHLTGGSLQSSESLFEVAAALGADPSGVGIKPQDLSPIFQIRNKIIHELDVNLSDHLRTRNLRSQKVMVSHTNRIFVLAANLVRSAHARLPIPGAGP
jgi:hypothetical protein